MNFLNQRRLPVFSVVLSYTPSVANKSFMMSPPHNWGHILVILAAIVHALPAKKRFTEDERVKNKRKNSVIVYFWQQKLLPISCCTHRFMEYSENDRTAPTYY